MPSAANVLAKVPPTAWAVLAFVVVSAYLVRRASDAAGSVVDAAVGAAQDVATGVARVVVAPAVIANTIAKSAGIGAPDSSSGIAAADAAFEIGTAVSDAVQSVPGAIGAIDAVFGVVDKVLGIKHGSGK